MAKKEIGLGERLISGVVPWALLLIVVGYLGLTLVYTAFTPPFEGPDEPQHFAYIEWLVRHNAFPPQGDAAWETAVEQEASQSPLYYLLASIPARLVGVDNPQAIFRPNPYFVGPLPRDFPDNDNRAIHYPGDASPLAGGWLALYLARGVTMAFGVLLLVSIYHLVRRVLPERPHLAWFSVLVVGATPQVIFLGSVVSNDIPVAAVSTLALWALAALIDGGFRPWRAAAVGVSFGLAILTKVSAVALAVPIGLGMIWLGRSRRQTLKQFAGMCLWVGGSALLVAGWWFVRNWILYGSPVGLSTHDATSWAITQTESADLAWRRWWEVFRSFWIWLGWGTVRPDFDVYYVLFGLAILALLGLGLGAWRWWRKRESWTVTITPVHLLLLVVALLATALLLEVWMHRVVAPYGRLLYPALASIAVLLVLGWHSLHRYLPVLPIGFLLVLSLVVPTEVLRGAYAPPVILTEAEVAELGSSQGLRFGPSAEEAFAELVDATVMEDSVEAAGLVPVRVCWRTLGRPDRDYAVLAQVIGPQNRLIASRRTHPGLGTYPTSTWNTEEVFCDRVQIKPLQSKGVEPLVYDVEIGMIDPATNERVSIYDAQGNQWSVAFVDKVFVWSEAERGSPLPSLTEEGPDLRLVDSEVPGEVWQAGQTYGLTLQWAAAAPVSTDYQVFVHLREPATGELVEQADGPPLDGWYPTSWWPVAETITDTRTFPLPATVDPGTYDLVVGLYDLSSGQRYGDEYNLGRITVAQ